MRCYLMRGGRIHGIEFLKDGPDDKLIEQAKAILHVRSQEGFEGIELWSGNRFVYRTERPGVADQKGLGR
jgi:heme-degrading monooxygenase HmoA